MKILSPSVLRLEKPLETCAKIINAVGCKSVHVDVSIDDSLPGFYGKDILISGKIALFNCPAVIHVFTKEPFSGMPSCKFRKSDVVMLHVFPNTSPQQINMLLSDALAKTYSPAIALDINSDVDSIIPFIEYLKAVYVMGIPIATHGLPPGNKTKTRLIFLREVLKSKKPSCTLGIDGGINDITFPEIALLADEIVIGGLLFNAPNIYSQWRALSVWIAKLDGGVA